MPRSRSSGPSRSAAPRSRPTPQPASQSQHRAPSQQHHAPPPAPSMSAPPPAMQQGGGGGIMSGLMGSVMAGAAMGTGSAIAHRAVDSMMGPRTMQVEHVPAPEAAAPMAPAMSSQQEGPCQGQAKAFAECMARANGDMGACQYYFDAMQSCRTNFSA